MSFPCSQCGLCCLHAQENIEALKELMPVEFPYGFDETGACEQFDKETRLCRVYDHRPLICNYEKVHKTFYPAMEERMYNVVAAAVCNDMMDREKVDQKFRIDLKKI